MDNLTHSLVGALIGQAGLKRKTGLAMPALLIGANLPDVDVSCFLWLDGTEHLGFRRGITHGPPAWFLLPLVLAGVLYGYDKWQAKRGKRPEARLPVSFKWLYILSFIACLTHPAMDWLNSYGIRLLEPFSSEWFYGDTLFIIDIWLWLGLGFATWMSLHRERWGHNWRRPARIALAAMLAYIGVNWIFSMGAVTRNSDYFREGEQVIANPVPFTFWRRQMIKGMDGRYGVIDPGIESLDHATTGPEDYAKFISRLGICELTDADKQQIVATMPEAQPFLFWSRTPYVDQTEDGRIVLRDARFAGASRFEVELPEMPCTNPDGE